MMLSTVLVKTVTVRVKHSAVLDTWTVFAHRALLANLRHVASALMH